MIENRDGLVDFHISREKQGTCFFKLVSLLWFPFLIFLGVIAGYFEKISLKVELHSVIMIGTIFIIYLFFMKHNAYYATCKFKRRDEEMQNVLSWYVKNNQLTIGDVTKANAPIETFLKDFSATLRNSNFSSVAASVFPTLGILGTFISIALSMPDFSSQDSALLEKEISLLLGGVGTAFYVSIYGIFLSLWWIYFEKSGMSDFERNIDTIKENIKHHFWSKEEIEQIHFQESMKNFEKLNSVFSKITSNEFINEMHDSIGKRVDLFDNIINHEQNVLQKASAHFNDLLKVSQKGIKESDKFIKSYEDISSHLQKSSEILSIVHKELLQKDDKLQDVTRNLNQNIAQLNLTLLSLSEELKEINSKKS